MISTFALNIACGLQKRLDRGLLFPLTGPTTQVHEDDIIHDLQANVIPRIPDNLSSLGEDARLATFLHPFLEHLATGGPDVAAPYIWVYAFTATCKKDGTPLPIPTRKKYMSSMTAGLSKYLATLIQNRKVDPTTLPAHVRTKYTWAGSDCHPR